MSVQIVSTSAVVLLALICSPAAATAIERDDAAVKLYPETTREEPDVASPGKLADGTEVVIAQMKDGAWAVVPVTVENGPLNLPYGRRGTGKGRQLEVDVNDFPTLARTGLHAERELDRAATITGVSIDEITKTGRPEMASGAGFMAADENIISVLKGDNRLVADLGLTHPDMARPLFHIWNLMLKEYELHRIGRDWDRMHHVTYNGKKIRFGEVHPTRGFQESIFNDEIQGAWQINFFRELDQEEARFLKVKYPRLDEAQMAELTARMSHVLMGEMVPYYIMRYGFYEGHTAYRINPIAIAFIFGLRDLDEIEAAFPGYLYETLTTHFAKADSLRP